MATLTHEMMMEIAKANIPVMRKALVDVVERMKEYPWTDKNKKQRMKEIREAGIAMGWGDIYKGTESEEGTTWHH